MSRVIGQQKPTVGSVSNGSGNPHRSVRVAVGFEPPVFERIAGMAAQRKVSFATVVRELCEKALQRREH
jgi:predicted DNA-binding ribbon-helix-helix protein